jgi:predicted RNA-binding protein with PUA-like domain
MKYWLMKSEPSVFSITDLENKGQAFWDGIRNYQVRNMLRDDMRVGDQALFYHSSAGSETGVVGVMEVVSAAYPDPAQFDKKSKYYYERSDKCNPRWLGVEVKFIEKLSRLVTLAELKREMSFADLPLVQKGNRLSVMPLSKAQFQRMLRIAKK